MSTVKYHKFTGGIPIIFVERFSDFTSAIGAQPEELEEGHDVDNGNYFRTVGFKKSPLKFIVFEDAMMRTLFGHRRNDVVDATLAMYVAEKKYPMNEKLAHNFAIKMVIENNAVGAYEILSKQYLNKFRIDNPYHKTAISEGIIEEAPDKHLNNPEYSAKYKDSHTHVSGGEGNLYVTGKMSREKAQEKAAKHGADAKLVKDKMVPLSQAEKDSAKGSEPAPEQQKKKVKVVKKDTGEPHPELSKKEDPKQEPSGDPDYEIDKRSVAELEKLRSKIENLPLKMDGDGSIKKQLSSTFDKIIAGEKLSSAEKSFFGQYIRPSLSGTKAYVATKEPGDFSQGMRGKLGTKTLANVLSGIGIEGAAATTSKSGAVSPFNPKDLSPAKVFTDDNGNLRKSSINIERTEKGFQIGDTKVSRINQPKTKEIEAALIKRGMQKDEAMMQANIIQASIRKHNGIVASVEKVLAEGGTSLDVIDILPDVTPDTSEGRKQLQAASIKNIRAKMEHHAGKHELIDELEKLETASGEEFDKIAEGILDKMWNDDKLAKGVADMVETISYARHLSMGKVAYMPEAANFPLGDVIVMSSKLDKDNMTVNDILNNVDIIVTSVDNRSIKKDQGGASSSRGKFELCATIPAKVRKDLLDAESTYEEIFDGDPKAAKKKILEFTKKYGIDANQILNDYSGPIASAMKTIKKKNPNIDEKELKERLSLYMILGRSLEKVHNDHIDIQMYSNERYTNTKTKGTSIDSADGVNRIALLKFEFNVGFSKNGKPGNRVPTRFHHANREDILRNRIKG